MYPFSLIACIKDKIDIVNLMFTTRCYAEHGFAYDSSWLHNSDIRLS